MWKISHFSLVKSLSYSSKMNWGGMRASMFRGISVESDNCSCRFLRPTTGAFSGRRFYASSPPQPPPWPDAGGFMGPQLGESGGKKDGVGEREEMSFSEAKKLMRLVNVEALKKKLGMNGNEVMSYSDLLQVCESMGVARSMDEATAYARSLDESGVILLFRDKVYLKPSKVVDMVRRAVPLASLMRGVDDGHDDDNARKEELNRLEIRKAEIDRLAERQVRGVLWTGLGLAVVQVGLFFRMTFWDFSWDVIEPVAFFTTSSGIIAGYAYFMLTSRDPTYHDLMKSLYASRQSKLLKSHGFDLHRYLELQCAYARNTLE